jgi:hypothetical protein
MDVFPRVVTLLRRTSSVKSTVEVGKHYGGQAATLGWRTGRGRADYFDGGTLVAGGGVESDFGTISAAFAWTTFLSRVIPIRHAGPMLY